MKSTCPDCNCEVHVFASVVSERGVVLERAEAFVVSVNDGPPRREIAEVVNDAAYYVRHKCGNAAIPGKPRGRPGGNSKRDKYRAKRLLGKGFTESLTFAGVDLDGVPPESVKSMGLAMDRKCGINTKEYAE